MKEYTYGKKASMIVIHQMCIILMIDSFFAMNYFAHMHMIRIVGWFSVMSVLGLVGGLLILSLLTNMTGQRYENDKEIHYHLIDRMDSDVLMVLFILFIMAMIHITRILRHQDFTLPGILITAGTITYIMDVIFLLFYLSIMRRMKGDILFTGSRIYKVVSYLCSIYQNRGGGYPRTRGARERAMLQEAMENIAAGALDTKIEESSFHGKEREIACLVNHIQDGLREAVQESIRNERMKADLITNVSHDIKTPLTSIVNYVELLKRERFDNETADNYIRIIDDKAQRLKQLTEDLVEASKISSGNIKLDIQTIDLVELLYQTGGEFNERFEARDLTIVTKLPHMSVMIRADGRQLYRVIENLYTNAAKYALEKSRVYVELVTEEGNTIFTIKNIAKNRIQVENGDGNNLTERFVRGETSRTTEGSGLGLSIAKNLTQLMGGKFEICIEDDVFLAKLTFPLT